jgi:hypothetical protein
VRVAELRRGRRDEQVARQRQLEATGEAETVDLGDRRDGRAASWSITSAS